MLQDESCDYSFALLIYEYISKVLRRTYHRNFNGGINEDVVTPMPCYLGHFFKIVSVLEKHLACPISLQLALRKMANDLLLQRTNWFKWSRTMIQMLGLYVYYHFDEITIDIWSELIRKTWHHRYPSSPGCVQFHRFQDIQTDTKMKTDMLPSRIAQCQLYHRRTCQSFNSFIVN